jgi:hypothetical protein
VYADPLNSLVRWSEQYDHDFVVYMTRFVPRVLLVHHSTAKAMLNSVRASPNLLLHKPPVYGSLRLEHFGGVNEHSADQIDSFPFSIPDLLVYIALCAMAWSLYSKFERHTRS